MMKRKIDKILFLGCLALVVIAFIECSSAKTVSDLDVDLDVDSNEDLVAEEVKVLKKESKKGKKKSRSSSGGSKKEKKAIKEACKEKKCGDKCCENGQCGSKEHGTCDPEGKCLTFSMDPDIEEERQKACEDAGGNGGGKDQKPKPGIIRCKKDKECKCLKTGRGGRPSPPFTGKCDIKFGKYKTCNCDCDTCPSPGRPFTVDGAFRIPTSLVGNTDGSNAGNTWKMNDVPSVRTNSSLSQVIAMEFSDQGEGEHASVASFARHTLQLLSMGAPGSLLMGSQKAALDEIKHAKMCYSIAETFLGDVIQPSTLDIDGSVRAQSKEEVIQSVINEGCIGETISAVRAQVGSQYAKQPMIKDMLETIAADETNHAQLAWNTVQWAIERFPELRDVAEETFRARLDRPMETLNSFPTGNFYDCDQDSTLHDHGLLLDEDHIKTENLSIKNVIGPVVENEFQNVGAISTQILNIDFSKY